MVPEIWSATDKFFSFWTIFVLLQSEKSKFLKNEKTPGSVASVVKIMIICYTVPEIWRVTNVIFIYNFGLFFAILANSPKKVLEKRCSENMPKIYRCHSHRKGDFDKDTIEINTT